jgi:hypothetical protein
VATVLALVGFLLIPLLVFGAAVLDNKLRFGWWTARKEPGEAEGASAPLPFERLSAADRDSWIGGGGGA